MALKDKAVAIVKSKSDTIKFGHVVAVLGIALANLDKLGLAQVHYGIAFMVISMLIYGFRAKTDTPLEDR